LLYPDPRRLQLSDGRNDLAATALAAAPIVDGYFDDWERPNWHNLADERRPLRVALGVHRDRLYMVITIADRTKRYRREPALRYGDGDHLVVQVKPGNTPTDYAIAPAAPGFFSVLGTSGQQAVNMSERAPSANAERQGQGHTLQGAWVEFAEGYQLELSLPLEAVGYQLGLTYLDVDEGGFSTRGNTPSSSAGDLPWLSYPSEALQAWFNKQISGTAGAQIYDRWGALLISRNARSASEVDTELHTQQHRGDELIDRFVTPIESPNGIVGAVAIEETRANTLSVNGAAVQTLLIHGGAAVLLSLLALFGFAGLISWRVIELSRRITNHESTASQPLAQFRWHDEIDALAQQFQKLLAQRDQTEQYLRALPRTLAHEIRTPVAIIGNSLEQLQGQALSTQETQTVLARTERP